MNSGITSQITHGRVLSSRGTHQKFDRAAYRIIVNRVKPNRFPNRSDILHFEGYNGPDGLKLKARKYNTDHLWDPVNEIGNLPLYIQSHYQNLVSSLKNRSTADAAFHAAWLAHYATDSLTPAHHMSHKLITAEYANRRVKKRILMWGRKGLMSSHLAFEVGVSSSIFFTPLNIKLDNHLYEQVRKLGATKAVINESKIVAKQHIYRDYLKSGWNTNIARRVRVHVINRIPQLIAALWLSACEDSDILK